MLKGNMSRYGDLQVPYIPEAKINHLADSFRKKFSKSKVPINIEEVIEVSLGIDVIPTPDLKSRCDTDALITSNWESIYVDKKIYMDERYTCRMRFSLAHEIGHYILHRSIWEKIKIGSIEQFYEFHGNFSPEQYGFLETQANKFAAAFLIPKDVLLQERDKQIAKFRESYPDQNIPVETMHPYLARPLADIFLVSPQTIEIALAKI